MHKGAYESTAFNREDCKQYKGPSIGSRLNKWSYIFTKNHAAMKSMNMDILTRETDIVLG